MSDLLLFVGVLFALAGAGSVLLDAVHAGGNPRFIAYLVGLLFSLAGVGMILTSTL